MGDPRRTSFLLLLADEVARESREAKKKKKKNLGEDREESSDPFRRVDEKLDKDFIFFVSYIPVTYRNIKDEHEKSLCRAWLKRLTSKKPQTVAGKRNRNTYLVNLILQMGDGKLVPPFSAFPPHDKLKPANKYFGEIEKQQPCSESLNFDIEDYSDFSRDERFYFALKSLRDGRGAFAYSAVSSGGGDTLWINAAGEPLSVDSFNKSKGDCPAETEKSRKIEGVLKDRTSSKERSGLMGFYEGLLAQVTEVIQNYGTGNEPYDPVIEKMIEDLQMEALVTGAIDCDTMTCYTRLHWLQDLQTKLQSQLDNAKAREMDLNILEGSVSQKEGITFVDISHVMKSPQVDTMFDEAARDRPSQQSVEFLKRNYPECVVQKLLVLLEKEKFSVISQERNIYQDFILQLKGEIMNVVRRGLEKYALARKEWHRVVVVMRRVVEEKNKLLRELGKADPSEDAEYTEKDNLLEEELINARRKLEDAKERNEQVEARINSLHEQVHNMALEFERMESEAQTMQDELEQEICRLKKIIKQQERKIALLTKALQEKEEMCRL